MGQFPALRPGEFFCIAGKEIGRSGSTSNSSGKTDSAPGQRARLAQAGHAARTPRQLHDPEHIHHIMPGRPWEVVRFPAIAEADEVHEIATILEPRTFTRRRGEALHLEREPLDTLDRIRRTIGEYHFAGQYPQSPPPLAGGLVKAEWFRRYSAKALPETFERLVQSWDHAK